METEHGFEIGAEVLVYSFGAHRGKVVGHDPEIEIQGRKCIARGWVSVELDGLTAAPFPIWSGTPDHLVHAMPQFEEA
jgi:hypothetical protein